MQTMTTTRLGHTGLEVSRICLGCMSFGEPDRGATRGRSTRREPAAHPAGAGAGINFFDTANVYSDGTSEEIVGRALRDFARARRSRHRHQGARPMRAGPNGAGLSRKAILAEIDASLRRLGTDYVDLYQIHRLDRTRRSRRRWRRCTTW